MTERAVVFGSASALVGVLTEAEGGTSDEPPIAVLLINAGVVHHVGPHRLYVDLARDLAKRGFVVFRFDHAGIGDSAAREDHLPFEESSVLEVQEAMDWLGRELSCEKFVLLGLCSGTLTVFRTAQRDSRVVGLALLTALLEDPSTVSEELIQEAVDRRIARSYTTDKVVSRGSWKKFLTGRANYRRIGRVLVSALVSGFGRRHAVSTVRSDVVARLEDLLSRNVRVIFIFGEPTTVLEYFRMTLEPFLPDLRERGRIELLVLPRSDHTFSSMHDRRRVIDMVTDWVGSLAIEARSEGPAVARTSR